MTNSVSGWRCVGLCLLVATQAQATQTVSLELMNEGTASLCPEESVFKALVSAKLGRDPFLADAPLQAMVSFSLQGERVFGKLSLKDASGVEIGKRSVDAERASCILVAQTLAMALALAVDPAVLRTTPARPLTSEVSAKPPPASSLDAVPRPAPPPMAVWSVNAGGSFILGAMPSWAMGPRIELGWRRDNDSVLMEGSLFPQATWTNSEGKVQTSLLRGGVSGCRHLNGFGFCLRATGGLLRAEGQDFYVSKRGSAPTATVGPAVVYERRLFQHLQWKIGVSADAAFFRSRLTLDDRELWFAPPLSAEAFVSLGWSLP